MGLIDRLKRRFGTSEGYRSLVAVENAIRTLDYYSLGKNKNSLVDAAHKLHKRVLQVEEDIEYYHKVRKSKYEKYLIKYDMWRLTMAAIDYISEGAKAGTLADEVQRVGERAIRSTKIINDEL